MKKYFYSYSWSYSGGSKKGYGNGFIENVKEVDESVIKALRISAEESISEKHNFHVKLVEIVILNITEV